MKKINKKGFTLIELLVVIAIIGLLSTMAVISLNSARAKARDARRLSDVKQLSTTLSLAAADNASILLEGCVTADSNINTCAVTSIPSLATEFDKFTDPSSPAALCAGGDTAVCGYSIAPAAATVSTALIQFYLENASGGLTAGPKTISAEGIFAANP